MRNTPVQRDVVTIRYSLTVVPKAGIITGVSVIGQARRAQRFLRLGARVAPARRSLEQSGFELVHRQEGVYVFMRQR
ncbi:hypothetical protein ACFFK0_11050 [Paenibacillus chartarius]|uniref:N-acetyltransferase domain-containing protein n=1 Tax=Paenibacillus chartarius TaxID=747481 RepID=A0ABV6DK03_9BACL